MKKIIFQILFIPFFLVTELINWLFILMDELFFPSYKKIAVTAPLYITGMPRTGTTFIHNILHQDSKRFTTMMLWEIAFAPSILQKKIWIFINRIDGQLNRPLRKSLVHLEKRILKKFNSTHPLSLFQIEEDEYLLIHNFSSALLAFFFPAFRSVFISSVSRNSDIPAGEKRLRFYRNCIKKHLYVFGKDKSYLAKSPAHILRYSPLKKIFPDLKMIYMLRDPEKSIPSTISLFQNFNTIFHSGLKRDDIIQKTLLMADQCFNAITKPGMKENDPSFVIILFEEFIAEPMNTVTNIYNRFGYEMSDESKIKIDSCCRIQTEFISGHQYSLEKYSLTRSLIRNRYRDIYTAFYPSKESSAEKNN
ncbi:MAG: sulfotransferase [Bacteroidetes bacterium]|nr:sulfotransferase [Bacteroidota bacterium]